MPIDYFVKVVIMCTPVGILTEEVMHIVCSSNLYMLMMLCLHEIYILYCLVISECIGFLWIHFCLRQCVKLCCWMSCRMRLLCCCRSCRMRLLCCCRSCRMLLLWIHFYEDMLSWLSIQCCVLECTYHDVVIGSDPPRPCACAPMAAGRRQCSSSQ